MSPSDPNYPRGTHAVGSHVERCASCRKTEPEHPVPCACLESQKKTGTVMMCFSCTECPKFEPRKPPKVAPLVR